MRKNVFGRQFSRDTNQRKNLFRSLIASLILEESIHTTSEKAKAIKGDVDKIINKAKRGDERLATQLLQRSLGILEMNKVIKELAPRFKNRTSGYTRIIKLGRRLQDNAAMVVIEFVDKKEIKDQKSDLKSEVKGLPAGKVEEKSKAKKEVVKPVKKEAKKKTVKK